MTFDFHPEAETEFLEAIEYIVNRLITNMNPF